MQLTVAAARHVADEVTRCTHLTGNPISALRFIRSRDARRLQNFRYRNQRFKGRREDWNAIKEVLSLDEYGAVDCLLSRKTSPRVLDVGANIGCFAIRVFASAPTARVLSVEAGSDTFALLEENRRANPDFAWRCLHAGAWGSDRPLTLKRGASSLSHQVVEDGEGETVRGISLANLLREAGWDRVDLMKMDIEGGEASAIPGGMDALNRTNILIVEIHSDRIDAAPVDATLRSIFKRRWQINHRTSVKPVLILANEDLVIPNAVLC